MTISISRRSLAAGLALTGLTACASIPTRSGGVSESVFGQMPDGRPVKAFDLTGVNGMTARIIEYGGIVVSLTAPDRDGVMGDVVLGLDTLED